MWKLLIGKETTTGKTLTKKYRIFYLTERTLFFYGEFNDGLFKGKENNPAEIMKERLHVRAKYI